MRTSLVLAFLLLALVCVVPVLVVLANTFVSEDGGLTFAHYTAVLGVASRWGVLWDSVRLAALATVIALLIGLPYALFVTRVRTPFRSVLSALYILPLVLPPLLMCMGWTQFLRATGHYGHDAGFLGTLFTGVSGAALLFGFAYFPFVTLFARKAFTEIGAGLEEAARIHTGPLRAFLRITLPLAMPSILAGALFVFLFALADFSVVDYLSTIAPVKERVSAYSFEAFAAWNTNYQEAGRREAAALGAPIAAISLLCLYVIYRLLRKGSYATVTSGHVRPGDIEEQASPWMKALLRGGGLVFVLCVLGLSVGIPIGRLVVEAASGDGIVANVRSSLTGDGGALADLGNSLQFALLAALLMTALALVLGHHVVRGGPRREALVLCLSVLPLAFGPIMFGAGLIRTWNHPWLELGNGLNPIYDTSVVVVLMLTGKYLPFALIAVSSSLKRIDPGYEEAAAVAGIGPFGRLMKIAAPLATRGIAAGFILAFVFSLRELDTIVLLTAGNRTAMMKIYSWVHIAQDANVASLSLVLVLLIALPFLLFSLVTAKRLRVV